MGARVIAAACLVAALAPSAASAATARMETHSPETTPRPTFRAAPGEINQLTVTMDASTTRFADVVAPVTASDGCDQVSPHEALCPTQGPPIVELGDASDTAAASATAAGAFLAIYAGPGDDAVDIGSSLSASVIGGTGDDRIGGPGAALMRIFAGPGNDDFTGGPEGDLVDMGGGHDAVHAGGGDDEITDGDPAGTDLTADADVLDGGPGFDELSYRRRTAGVSVTLATPGGDGQPGEDDDARGIERVVGGRGDDTLRGSDGSDVLVGAAGADRLQGAGGIDVLEGKGGGDVIDGGGGEDDIFGGSGADSVGGGAGDDQMRGGIGPDAFDAGGGDDFVLARERTLPPPGELVDCGAGDDEVASDRGDVLGSRCERAKRRSFEIGAQGRLNRQATLVRFPPYRCNRGRTCILKIVLHLPSGEPAGQARLSVAAHARRAPVIRLTARAHQVFRDGLETLMAATARRVVPGRPRTRVDWRFGPR